MHADLHPGAGLSALRPHDVPTTASLRYLQTHLLWLIQQLRWVLLQTGGQFAQLLRSRPALAQQPLELGQTIAGERPQVLAVFSNELLQLVSGVGKVVSDNVHTLDG